MTDPKKLSRIEKSGIRKILESILEDIVLNHKTPTIATSLSKDKEVILSCFDNRGLPFLAKDLPLLGSALDRGLVDGKLVIPLQFKHLGYTALPKLFNALWSKVFDHEGLLLSDPSISAIVDLRFLTKAFYKYEVDYDEATVESTVAAFIQTDKSLPVELPSRGPLFAVLDVARTLICEVLGKPPKFFIPGHSAGAVATAEKAWVKTEGLLYAIQHRVLGGYSNLYVNPREAFYNNSKVIRQGLAWFISKLVPVPKDSRGPRLIGEEPVTQQFLQQGIKEDLYPRIENHPLTKGHVNFTDQEINRKLAVIGSSIEPETVTLDMKEASDRIPYILVDFLICKEWMELFDAVRTELMELPNGRIIDLRKFAPMGSALCFPIESIVHWALCCAVYMLRGYSSKTVFESVYVYGDDIVLRSLPPGDVFKIFPYFGLKFNEAKSCCTGKFRESCGVDAFSGTVVTTTKFKKRLPDSSGMPEAFVAWVEYSNLCFERGYLSTSKAIQEYIEGWYKFPYVRPNADCIGYTSLRPFGLRPFLGVTKNTKSSIASAIDDRSPLYRCLTTRPKRPRAELVCDRSRYFETILELARRPNVVGPTSPFDTSTQVAYAKRNAIRFKKILSKDVVAFDRVV